MKISTNTIGNYGPQIPRSVPKQEKAKEVFNLSAANLNNAKAEITSDEKKFFVEMYPESKTEISNHFYSKNGKMNGVKIGSLFNKRG